MKRTNRLSLAATLLLSLLALPLTGCQNPVKGSGELETEELDFTGFSRVEVEGPFEVDISPADAYSVSITADDNIFEKIEISNEDDTLRIRLKSASFLGILRAQYIDTTARIAITAPQLRGLLLAGAAQGTLSGFTSRAGMDIEISGASTLDIAGLATGDACFIVSGASKVNGDIIAGDAAFDISGASDARLAGSANDIAGRVSGASQLDLGDFIAANADMRLSGASTSSMNLEGKLDVDLSGASELIYAGEPILGDTKISGGSTMSRK